MAFDEIRKFGLAYSDFPTMLSNISFFLRTLSLNIDPRDQKQIPRLYTILDVLFTASYCYVYLVSMIWFIFWRCAETGDLLTALIIFSLGVASEIGLYKIMCMFIYKNKLHQLVEQCLTSYAFVEPNSRFSINLTKDLRNVKKRALVFWFMVIGNGILYILKPTVLPGRHLLEDSFVILGLEPIFESPNYEIILILSAMGVFLAVYLSSNATAFQIIIVGYIEAQMLAWSEELAHLWDDAQNDYLKYVTTPANSTANPLNSVKTEYAIVNEFVDQRLKTIVKAHAANINLLKNMESIFRVPIAVEFSLLIVCLIAELVGGLKNTYLEVPFALAQVGMDCIIGQKLTDASVVFEKAVYFCKWENFNKDNMKMVMTMMMTSQKTMTLSAGGVTKLDYVSFIAIVKMIYTAYTTLSAAMD